MCRENAKSISFARALHLEEHFLVNKFEEMGGYLCLRKCLDWVVVIGSATGLG